MSEHDERHHHAVQRYMQLPELSRDLLEDEDRVRQLIRASDFMAWVETTSRYIKWSVLTVLAVAITVFSLADYISRTLAWFRGG